MDDLVERLRDDNSDYVYTERHEAAARIQALETAIRAGAHESGPAPDGSFPGDAIVRREVGFSWDSCQSAG